MPTRDDSDFQAVLDADARDLGFADTRSDTPAKAAVRNALLRVVGSIQRATAAPAPSKVEPVNGDVLANAVRDAVEELLGTETGGVYRAPVGARFPIFGHAYETFRTAAPPPWTLRVDCEDTDAAWREERRQPYLEVLADRVAVLEKALAEHASDNHTERLTALERAFDQHVVEHDVVALGEDVRRAKILAEHGGDLVPLSVEPSLARGVRCWQDGDEILCSLFHRSADGVHRVLTAGIPYAACLDGAVRHVVSAGVDPLEIAPVFPRVAQALGASIMFPRIAAVAPAALALAGGEVPFLCRVTTPGDPALAAAMSLVQRARGGDATAREEVRALRAEGAGMLFDRADRQLNAVKKARTR